MRMRPDFDRGCYNLGTVCYSYACTLQSELGSQYRGIQVRVPTNGGREAGRFSKGQRSGVGSVGVRSVDRFKSSAACSESLHAAVSVRLALGSLGALACRGLYKCGSVNCLSPIRRNIETTRDGGPLPSPRHLAGVVA